MQKVAKCGREHPARAAAEEAVSGESTSCAPIYGVMLSLRSILRGADRRVWQSRPRRAQHPSGLDSLRMTQHRNLFQQNVPLTIVAAAVPAARLSTEVAVVPAPFRPIPTILPEPEEPDQVPELPLKRSPARPLTDRLQYARGRCPGSEARRRSRGR